jgi:hypothetical protein
MGIRAVSRVVLTGFSPDDLAPDRNEHPNHVVVIVESETGQPMGPLSDICARLMEPTVAIVG